MYEAGDTLFFSEEKQTESILRFQKINGRCMEVRLQSPVGKFKITNM